MKKLIRRVTGGIVFLAIIAGLAFAARYAAGFWLLRSTGIDTSMLTFNTFPQMSALLAHNRAYLSVFLLGWVIQCGLPCIPLIPVVMLLIIRAVANRQLLHGNARFASNAELQTYLYKGDYRE